MPLEYVEKFDDTADSAANILGSTKNFAVATATDLVVNTWNSLPFTENKETEAILQDLDEDAMNFYNRNKDTVEFASFLGGIIVPSAVSLKLLNAARAGTATLGKTNIVVDTFSGLRKKELASEIETLYKIGGGADSSYKIAKGKLFADAMANNVIDMAVMEAAIYGTLNAHPYMEDYKDNPWSSFAFGVGIGSAIGAIPAYISTKAALRAIEAPILTNAFRTALEGYSAVPEGITNAAKYQRHQENITRLVSIAEGEELNPLTKRIVDQFIIDSRARQTEALEKAAPFLKLKEFKDLKPEIIDFMRNEAAIGVEEIRILKLGTNPTFKGTTIVDDIVAENTLEDSIISAGGFKKAPWIFYDPQNKLWMTSDNIGSVGKAVDLREFKLAPKEVAYQIPTQDMALEIVGRATSTAEIDGLFLNELAAFSKLKKEDFKFVVSDPDQLARLQAMAVWAAEHAEDAKGIKVKIRSDMPTYDNIEKYVETIITKTVTNTNGTVGASTVKSNYWAEAKRLVGSGSVFDAPLGNKAFNLLDLFQGGGSGQTPLRHAMDAFLRGTRIPDSQAVTAAEEIWKAGQKWRDAYRQIADPEGFVYFYRGTRRTPRGSSAVESYTPDRNIARNFGDVRLYKVHVDNIITQIGNSRGFREAEILVGSPHHQIVQDIATGAQATMSTPATTQVSRETILKTVQKEASTGTEIELTKMKDFVAQKKIDFYKLMQAEGVSVPEMAIRLNVNPRIAEVLGSLDKEDLLRMNVNDWLLYNNSTKISSEYLNENRRTLAVRGNPYALEYSGMVANLDARTQQSFHIETVKDLTQISGSKIANDVLGIFNNKTMTVGLDILRSKVNELNNAVVGSNFLASADQALRKVTNGDLITFIGKSVINMSDNLRKEMLVPLAEKFSTFRTDTVGLAEFNRAVNFNAGLQGWRNFIVDPETGFGIFYQALAKDTNKPIPLAVVKNANAIAALQAIQEVSTEMRKFVNLTRSIKGGAPVRNLGFYIPSINLVNKHISYVFDVTSGKTQLLVAETSDELAKLEQTWKAKAGYAEGRFKVISRSQVEDYNVVKGYTDFTAEMEMADPAMFHSGASKLALTPSDSRFIDNIMQSFDYNILVGVRKYSEIYLSDITGVLDNISKLNQQYAASQTTIGRVFKYFEKDSAKTAKNILLGRDQLEAHTTWKGINEVTDMGINLVGKAINNVTKTFSGKKSYEQEFKALNEEFAKAGISPVWKSFDDYLATKAGETKSISQNVVSAGQGLIATLNLRLLELGQPLVNMLSLPILTNSRLLEKLPGEFLGATKTDLKLPLRYLYDGIAESFTPAGRKLTEAWEKQGFIKQTVRQYTELIGQTKTAHVTQGGLDIAIDGINKFVNSDAINLLSKPADFAENFTRNSAMHIGFKVAKTAYPGIDDAGATIFAVGFTDRAIGNYFAAQRPAIFQGTLGAMVGLYQTYFWTFAQSIYRMIEDQAFRGLATMALTQGAMFGISSFPGFHALSQFVADKYSNKNWDFESGTYRALPDPLAEMLLYGMPSSLGPALYTRGDINPRIPSGPESLAVANGVTQGFSAVYNTIDKVVRAQPGARSQALLEGLSLQSVNRPIARLAEIVSGESVTSKGNTVSPSTEVWTTVGIGSRLLATRPLEEQVLRNVTHLNSYYGSVDFEARRKVVKTLKEAVRAGTLDEADISSAALDYMKKGGSAKGWNSAMNELLVTTPEGSRYELLRKLEPDSPLRVMIRENF